MPFFLVPTAIDLVLDHPVLIREVREELAGIEPSVVVIDTLNRSLSGSESSDQDMSSYVRAADAIRDAFQCAVILVHHCGLDANRPRGHTSLTGAADCQIAVKKNATDVITATVEWMKDGPDGDNFSSFLETLEVGTDEDGDPITSCVLVETEAVSLTPGEPRLTPNQKTMFSILKDAREGLTMEEWNNLARDAGLAKTRPASLYDFRTALQNKGLVYEAGGCWRAR